MNLHHKLLIVFSSLFAIIGLLFAAPPSAKAQTATPTPTITPRPVIYGRLVESTHGGFGYVGTWTIWTPGTNCSGGSAQYTISDSAWVSLRFIGVGISVWAAGGTGAAATICIDDSCTASVPATLNACSPTYVSDPLSYGIHELTIIPQSASSAWYGVDAVEIWGGDGGQAVDLLSSDELATGNKYAISRTATFGDLAIGALLIVLSILLMLSIFVSVAYGKPNNRVG